MCAGAIVQARLPTVVYGTADPKAGAVHTLYRLLDDPRLNHRARRSSPACWPSPCGEILSRFFQAAAAAGEEVAGRVRATAGLSSSACVRRASWLRPAVRPVG